MSEGLSIGDTVVGRYKLLDLLGVSSTRSAYRAYDSEVEVEVALWSMRAELFSTHASRAAFVTAAKRAREVRHPHLLRIFEVDTHVQGFDESLYLTQQLGTSAELEGRLSAGGMAEPATILRYAQSLSTALDALHTGGLYHGWLMPADVVEVASQVKLCGAGLFADLQAESALAIWGEGVRYLDPELVESGRCSAASDWYGLGVILLELALGEPALSVPESLASLSKVSTKQAEALSLVLAPKPEDRIAAGVSFMAGVKRAWEEPNAATAAYHKPVNLKAPAPDSNYAPTLSMEQSFIDAEVAQRIAAHRAETSLMVSEVDQRRRFPVPPRSPALKAKTPLRKWTR